MFCSGWWTICQLPQGGPNYVFGGWSGCILSRDLSAGWWQARSCYCMLEPLLKSVWLTRAYLDESSKAPAEEKGLTFHLIPCLLGTREYVVKIVEWGWEWAGHFKHNKSVEVQSHEHRNGAIASHAWLAAGMRDSCVLTTIKPLTFI